VKALAAEQGLPHSLTPKAPFRAQSQRPLQSLPHKAPWKADLLSSSWSRMNHLRFQSAWGANVFPLGGTVQEPRLQVWQRQLETSRGKKTCSGS